MKFDDVLPRQDVFDRAVDNPGGEVDNIDLLLFGFPLALTGGEAIVGAPGDDDDGWRSGSVYRFSVPLFTDGFESGDTLAWSSSVPRSD